MCWVPWSPRRLRPALSKQRRKPCCQRCASFQVLLEPGCVPAICTQHVRMSLCVWCRSRACVRHTAEGEHVLCPACPVQHVLRSSSVLGRYNERCTRACVSPTKLTRSNHAAKQDVLSSRTDPTTYYICCAQSVLLRPLHKSLHTRLLRWRTQEQFFILR